MKVRFRNMLAALAVFVAAVLPFARTAEFGLVNLDDYAYAENDELVAGGLSPGALVRAFADVSQHIWMPLTWASYMADHEIARRFFPDPSSELRDGGERPFPVHRLMHVHSVALHGVNAVLLFVLLSCLFRGRISVFVSALAALFWAMHPLRCESVCWIASRKDVLSMMFLLAALAGWCRFRRAAEGGRPFASRGAIVAYVLSFAFFCLGAMAKPSVMAVPALMAIVDVVLCSSGRAAGLIHERRDAPWRRLVPHLLAYLPFLLLAAAVGLSAKWFQDFGESMMPSSSTTFVWRLFNAVNSVGVYIWHTFVPGGLAVQCVIRFPAMPRLWPVALPVSLAALGFIFFRLRACWAAFPRAGAFLVRPADRILLPGLVWFVVSVAPMLGIAGFGYHAFADRFTYIPAVGFSLILAAFFAEISSGKRFRRTCAGVGAAALAALGGLSCRQSSFWRDDLTLFSRTLAVDGDSNYAAHFNIGFHAWEFSHDLDACIAHYGRAYALNPEFVVHSGMAPYVTALCEKGRPREAGALVRALSDTESATFGASRSSGFYAARGLWFLASDMGRGASEDLEVLERDTPDSAHRHFLAMKVAEHEGNLALAAEHLAAIRRAAVRHVPDYARYRYLCR